MKLRDYRYDTCRREKKVHSNTRGRQYPIPGFPKVGNSAFRPKFGMLILSAAEQILLQAMVQLNLRAETYGAGCQNRCEAIRGHHGVIPRFPLYK